MFWLSAGIITGGEAEHKFQNMWQNHLCGRLRIKHQRKKKRFLQGVLLRANKSAHGWIHRMWSSIVSSIWKLISHLSNYFIKFHSLSRSVCLLVSGFPHFSLVSSSNGEKEFPWSIIFSNDIFSATEETQRSASVACIGCCDWRNSSWNRCIKASIGIPALSDTVFCLPDNTRLSFRTLKRWKSYVTHSPTILHCGSCKNISLTHIEFSRCKCITSHQICSFQLVALSEFHSSCLNADQKDSNLGTIYLSRVSFNWFLLSSIGRKAFSKCSPHNSFSSEQYFFDVDSFSCTFASNWLHYLHL